MQQWARFAILGAIFVTTYLLILAWQKDYGQANQVATTAQTTTAPVRNTQADIPSHVATATTATDVPQAAVTQAATPATPATTVSNLISVTTDMYQVKIDPVGGDIVHLALLTHDKSKKSDEPFVMLHQDQQVYVAQSGLIGQNGPDQNPNGRPRYEVEKMQYGVADFMPTGTATGDTLTVPLVYKTTDGVEIFKTFTFKKGEYPIEVNHRIVNRSANNWQGQMFGQLKRDGADDPGTASQGMFTLGTYLGGAWGTPDEHYNKLKFSNFNDERLNQSAQGGWVAIVQHYFVSAWVPNKDYVAQFESRNTADGMHIIGFRSPLVNVPAGKQYDISATLYAGPKIQSDLKALATGLNQTVDYGWLWPIAQLLFWGLEFFHKIVGNWGWAIVLLTVLVKLILWPLSAKAYRSMAKMRVIAPEMQRMKDEFGDDRMRFSQEMMALYKREQVNPLSGCMPLLLQMPIFLALYWVLMESVELRHAPWLGWIQDLSTMDPWFILPLFMGATMYVQQLLNPQPTDPIQAKVFKMMPIIFTVFLLFFPAGLVLYWIVNNLITIAQQGYINKTTEKERLTKQA